MNPLSLESDGKASLEWVLYTSRGSRSAIRRENRCCVTCRDLTSTVDVAIC